jgi:hypothetical protein
MFKRSFCRYLVAILPPSARRRLFLLFVSAKAWFPPHSSQHWNPSCAARTALVVRRQEHQQIESLSTGAGRVRDQFPAQDDTADSHRFKVKLQRGSYIQRDRVKSLNDSAKIRGWRGPGRRDRRIASARVKVQRTTTAIYRAVHDVQIAVCCRIGAGVTT